MIFIKNKTEAALVDPLKFVTVSFAAIIPNNWAVGEAGEKKGIIQAFLSTSRNEILSKVISLPNVTKPVLVRKRPLNLEVLVIALHLEKNCYSHEYQDKLRLL